MGMFVIQNRIWENLKNMRCMQRQFQLGGAPFMSCYILDWGMGRCSGFLPDCITSIYRNQIS